jgi:galactose mutarotase-like enzyme
MMFTLKNDQLEIEVNAHGAELVRVVKNGINYLWEGNPEYWGRTSPVLFPIVGAVAEGKYFVNGEVFQLGQHGFARDMDFELVSQDDKEICFRIVSTEVTRKKYPFDFELRIGYVLDGDTIVVKWEVTNTGDVTMPFSIGAHPAFMAGPDLSDYALQMKDSKGIETYVFDNERGLVDVAAGKVEVIENLPFLPLSKDLFEEYPTLILEGESEIMLRSYTHDREVKVAFAGFPYVGIWSPINAAGKVAPFVCIEPWYGMADTLPTPGVLAEKKGIQLLEASEKFEANYTMTFR